LRQQNEFTSVAGPLQEWLLSAQREYRQGAVRRGHGLPARPVRRSWRATRTERATPAPSKRLFLVELECCGDVPTAAERSGCTAADVRHWRLDPMFDRDFTFAAAGHLRILEQMLTEATATRGAGEAGEARKLLDSKTQFLGTDGRLDAIAWRNALRRCAADLALDIYKWEPREPAEASA
jgi:hypothetical protein